MAARKPPTHKPLTHFDAAGGAHMVAVTAKAETQRSATATSFVAMNAATLRAVRAGTIGKGDVLGVARLAGIMATKRCADLIPLCHPLRITGVHVTLRPQRGGVAIAATVDACDRTGVEMEALTAASVAALTVYDMCKAIDKSMVIGPTQLEHKVGGKSGDWQRSQRGVQLAGKR